ncbi:hypothetical protein FJTKL_02576 [Diaporthe vaccinii]|uniref:Uncharacterized protein n=1 Tax=Diaporthe vaccinii TaxID=105482 RepID=A0ABR4DXZ2_9PEZI
MSFVYPAINWSAEEPAWSLCLGLFLPFVEPINGSSFRSSTTLSSYMLLYKLLEFHRGTGGPPVRRQALPGYV